MKEKGLDSSKVLGIKVLPSYLFAFLLFMACTLSGCIEEFEADISDEDSDLLVVEGSICASRLNKFTLSRTQALNSSTNPRLVMGAIVSVRGSDGSEQVAQAADGYYSCWMDDLAPDVEYFLHIEADGEVYESEPQKPLRTEKIAEVCGVQDTPESDIDVLVTPEAPFNSDQTNYYSWTYDETWEVHPDYTTTIYFDTDSLKPLINAYQFPVCGWRDATGTTIMVGSSANYDGQHIRRLKMYDVARNSERVFYRYSGLVHQRAISKAEYEYELARRQAGSEMGGLFTPQPSALPSNIHCLTSNKHVIGYIGCSLNTSEYRFFFNPDDFTIYRSPQEDKRVWLENPSMQACCKMVEKGLYLCKWEDPMMSPDGVLRTAWATIEQLDVRYKYRGAYVEEPDFWSLEENVSY